MLKLLTPLVLVLITLTSTSVAQETSPDSPSRPVRSALKLEVNYSPSIPPTFIEVHRAGSTPSWIWVTRFVRVPGWQLPDGELPVRAVRLEPLFNGETTDVRITVMRGAKTLAEQEQLVTNVHLEVGERRSITQLKQFGVEPFVIAVNNTPTMLPPEPVFDIRVNAIEIAGVERRAVPLPSYRLKFRNLTGKSINALRVEVVHGYSGLFQGEEGKPLIEPGGMSELTLPVSKTVEIAGRTIVGSSNVNKIVITSAVFADGTHDGDDGPACAFHSMSVGRARWLRTVIPLLEQQALEVNTDAPSGAAQLKEKLLALKFDVSEPVQTRVSISGSECAQNTAGVELTEQAQRQTFVRELDQIISTRPAPPVNFSVWLENTKARYTAWLLRLEQQGY